MLCGSDINIWNPNPTCKSHEIKWSKEYQTLSFQFFTNRFSILIFLILFFHVVCKISNFDKWTAKHLVQAPFTELTLLLDETNLPSMYISFLFQLWFSWALLGLSWSAIFYGYSSIFMKCLLSRKPWLAHKLENALSTSGS